MAKIRPLEKGRKFVGTSLCTESASGTRPVDLKILVIKVTVSIFEIANTGCIGFFFVF